MVSVKRNGRKATGGTNAYHNVIWTAEGGALSMAPTIRYWASVTEARARARCAGSGTLCVDTLEHWIQLGSCWGVAVSRATSARFFTVSRRRGLRAPSYPVDKRAAMPWLVASTIRTNAWASQPGTGEVSGNGTKRERERDSISCSYGERLL